jgi:hypothetical protein
MSDVAPEPDASALEAQIADDEAELAAEERTVTVRLLSVAGSTFESGIPGVPIITSAGVQVAAGQLQAVTDAAAANHLSLIVEENP